MEDAISDKSEGRQIDTHENVADVEKTQGASGPLSEKPPIDPVLDRRVTRKFDTRVVPWLFGMWLLAFIDRANIGNAKIDGLVKDLRLKGTQFNSALAIFYVPYIIVDVPSNLVLKYFRAGYYLPALLVAWGLVDTFMGFVKNYAGLLAARFFLGMAEGGLLGGMVIFLAMFYPRHKLMIRIGLFYCAAPLSGAFGGLLATGLAEIKTPGFDGWPFIFIVEGAITVLYGLVAMLFLAHSPNDAKFLTEEEREVALARMREDSNHSLATDVKYEEFDWYWVKRAVLNWNTMLLALNFFLIITPIYSFSLFLPTIVKGLGFSQVVAQLLTVPPNMAGFCTVIITCWLSDRYKRRGIFMLVGISVAIGGYIMLLATPDKLVQYGGTFLVAAGIYPCSPVVMGWLSNNLSPHYVRATGTGFQIMVANCAAFIATFTYIMDDAPRYITGHAINLGVLVLALICTAVTMWYNAWENKKRERGERDHRLTEEDEGLLGYRHPAFRYTI